MQEFLKVLRFLAIYGPVRTLYKVVGRTRMPVPISFRRYATPDIVMLGCGQFGFSTVGYFISRKFGRRFRWCHDINTKAAQSFALAFGVPNIAEERRQYLDDDGARLVYIATNHASHADYAVEALDAGKAVYVEKPIAVSLAQLGRLLAASRRNQGKLFFGYNRPFSGAIRFLRGHVAVERPGPISLQCFVSGHVIAQGHWYRDPAEGTRICGNAGHWIDLFVHMLAWHRLPDEFRITVVQADPSQPDDNICVAIATDAGDLFSLFLTSRSEPFEGINETINIQQGNLICKIDDFRTLTLWEGASLIRRNFWPKDVGHRLALLQPFQQGAGRSRDEVLQSTILMLKVAEMVSSGVSASTISMSDELMHLAQISEAA